MRLSARCTAILDEAELRVSRLLSDGGPDEDEGEPAF